MLGRSIVFSPTETLVSDETPSGTKNGVNASFTLVNIPIPSSFNIFLNGLRLRNGTDYILIGSALELSSAPLSTDSLVCSYSYQ